MKENATTSRDSTFKTAASAKRGASDAVAAVLPSDKSLSRSVRQIRQEMNDYPLPKSLKHMKLPDAFKLLSPEKNFYFMIVAVKKKQKFEF